MSTTTLYQIRTDITVDQVLAGLQSKAKRFGLDASIADCLAVACRTAEPINDLCLVQIHPLPGLDDDAQPHFLAVSSLGDATEVRLLSYAAEIVDRLLSDSSLPPHLSRGYRRVIELIDAVKQEH